MTSWSALLLLLLLPTKTLGVALTSTLLGASRLPSQIREGMSSTLEASIIPMEGGGDIGRFDGASASRRSLFTTDEEYWGLRGRSKRVGYDRASYTMGQQMRRRDQDVEDMLNDMATRDPSDWSAIEWFVMLLFLSFLGWFGCCLFALCCCGGCCDRGGGSCLFTDLLRYLCLWELCCRGGRDVAECCDYGLA
ncbi:hypothetical protein ACHAXA_004396 [Cyclostephanos tholiformis]|uniref:Uncharacterized protein n=1 Tax=Cyclostephanos tholiformis TaxID=382380 RepID=A0ABD3REQ2_9STRA